MTDKKPKKIDFNYEDKMMLTTEVTFEDDSKIYIFVQSGMIFVADCNYEELSKRIDNDDLDSYEAYDTIDLCDYYMNSDYAEYINTSLLYLMHRLFA